MVRKRIGESKSPDLNTPNREVYESGWLYFPSASVGGQHVPVYVIRVTHGTPCLEGRNERGRGRYRVTLSAADWSLAALVEGHRLA